MLKKLLKYDFKDMYKFLSVFYILSIVFAISTRILLGLKQTVIISIISQISIGFMFSMLASSLINTLMRNWVRFKDTLYKDESYLTHTLPVTKMQIYESKFILSLTNLATTFIVIFLSVLIAYQSKDNLSIITNYIDNVSKIFNVNSITFIIFMILILFLEIYTGLQSGFLGIILGHRKSNNKVMDSVIFGFIVYIICQLIVLLILFIVALFNSDVMKMFTDNVLPNLPAIKNVVLLFSIVYVSIIAVMNLICVKKLNKGVNVE